MLNNLYYTVETPVTVARTVSVADTVVEGQPHDLVLMTYLYIQSFSSLN